MTDKATEKTTSPSEPKRELQLLRTLRDELRLHLHLASMDAKTRWRELEPDLKRAERLLHNAEAAGRHLVGDLLRRYRELRDTIRHDLATSIEPRQAPPKATSAAKRRKRAAGQGADAPLP